MPITLNRGQSLQNIQHYAITDNPVFKVKVIGLKNNYEQPAGEPSKSDDFNNIVKKFKIGDTIIGNEKNSEDSYKGKIIKIDKDKQSIIILDKASKQKISLDPLSCKKAKPEIDSNYNLPFVTEHILSLEEFIEKGN